jgi:hypothetical protein
MKPCNVICTYCGEEFTCELSEEEEASALRENDRLVAICDECNRSMHENDAIEEHSFFASTPYKVMYIVIIAIAIGILAMFLLPLLGYILTGTLG